MDENKVKQFILFGGLLLATFVLLIVLVLALRLYQGKDKVGAMEVEKLMDIAIEKELDLPYGTVSIESIVQNDTNH